MEPNEQDLQNGDVINPVLPVFRPVYQGTIITNGGYEKESGNEAIAKEADLVSFGRLYIANPDLVQRFKVDAEFNEPNPKTFYGRGDNENAEAGYTDYPFLESK